MAVLGVVMAVGVLVDTVAVQPPKSCTILSVAVGGEVFFASNEDYQNPNTIIGFFPASPQGYGVINLGYRNGDGSLSWQLGVNDQGLVWDGNSLPPVPLNSHPERPYSGFGNYLSAILANLDSVDDAIELIGLYDFSHLGGAMNFQIHLADASGEAVVIGPGNDGELAFIGKGGEPYLVSTNFNRAIPTPVMDPESHSRYEKAVEMLDEIVASGSLEASNLAAILEATHVVALDAFTLYSVILDLKNGFIYLYHMSDFDEFVRFDIGKELAKGERVLSVADLFSEQARNQADSKYRAVVIRDILLRVILFGIPALTIGVLLSAVLRRKIKATFGRQKWALLSLFGLAVCCASWSIMLMLWHSYAPAIASSMLPGEMRNVVVVFFILGALSLGLFVVSIVMLSKIRVVTERRWQLSRGLVALGIPFALAAVYLMVGVVHLLLSLS